MLLNTIVASLISWVYNMFFFSTWVYLLIAMMITTKQSSIKHPAWQWSSVTIRHLNLSMHCIYFFLSILISIPLIRVERELVNEISIKQNIAPEYKKCIMLQIQIRLISLYKHSKQVQHHLSAYIVCNQWSAFFSFAVNMLHLHFYGIKQFYNVLFLLCKQCAWHAID